MGLQTGFAVLLAGLLALSAPARAAEAASADDTAKYLAGLPVPAASPLAPLEAEAGWKQHASYFNTAFARVDKAQLSKVRDWSSAHIGAGLRKPTLYYFFSGPDFLYANAFFPDATTYVMCGLEPVGPIPDLTKLKKGTASQALRTLQTAVRSLMGVSFFKTIDMKTELRSGPVTGTLPILYAFLARSGKTIGDVALVQIGADGTIEPESGARTGAHGAKITFSTAGGPAQTLYYFSVNIANDGFGKSGLGQFGERLGVGNALVKSASYLMHGGGFSQVRSFLMEKSSAIVQDDTGPPVALYDRTKWDVKPFGRYVGPISLFPGRGQPKMTELFHKEKPGPLGFGIGYRHRMSESSLLLAVKK
ncbi:hypothetical protein [Methylobacterium haplocladii]|uniref:hypothetical protein n=1 Tax=Methylobacterium haplocladii TaxID=1176176 RepID=UPI001EDC98E0|nr:hypothetical protein [Methylobacterium haplocladii]GJD84839.1 hypothetical protein HPGCJGGD_2722 [Methylobacterium haplocladii]